MRAFLAAAALLGLAACAQGPATPSAPGAPPSAPVATYRPVSFQALNGWGADDPSQALPALKRSCERLMRQGDDAPVGPNGLAGR
ncbi:MAG: murein transglycosylase, partial [Elsteraceae bacterium]